MPAKLAAPAESLKDRLATELRAVSPAFLETLSPPAAHEGYRRVTIHLDEEREVAAARWLAGGESILHGHGKSTALYEVYSGVVEEERYLPDGKGGFRCETSLMKAGERSYLPAGSYHIVRAREDAVTMHAYAPPPDHATEAVPAGTLAVLEQARRSAIIPECERQPLRRRPSWHRTDLLTCVLEHLEGWAEREAQANRDGQLCMPPQTVAELRRSGILTAPLPEALGGWGTTLLHAAMAVRRVAQRAPATALALVMPLGNAATTRIPEMAVVRTQRPLLRQGQRWIAEQVQQGKILAVANSEPGAGGDLASTKTLARRGDDGTYRLTGRKAFATFGRDSDYFLCAARRAETVNDKHPGIVDGFFVARNAPGLVIDDRWNPVGMRPTASVGLTLDNTPAEAILGFPGCLEGVNARHWSTVLFAAVFLGVGEGALREGTQQVGRDSIWARSALAERALQLDAAAGFVEAVARDDRFPMPSDLQERARRAKTFAARTAVDTAMLAATVSGGRSYTPDHPVFRFLCDALAGPLLRPPLPKAMDAIVDQLFPAA